MKRRKTTTYRTCFNSFWPFHCCCCSDRISPFREYVCMCVLFSLWLIRLLYILVLNTIQFRNRNWFMRSAHFPVNHRIMQTPIMCDKQHRFLFTLYFVIIGPMRLSKVEKKYRISGTIVVCFQAFQLKFC